MSNSGEHVRQGIAAYQQGDKARARLFLKEAIEADPRNQSAWLWMSGVVDSVDECVYCLQRVLHIDSNTDSAHHARNGLSRMKRMSDTADADTPSQEHHTHTPTVQSTPSSNGKAEPDNNDEVAHSKIVAVPTDTAPTPPAHSDLAHGTTKVVENPSPDIEPEQEAVDHDHDSDNSEPSTSLASTQPASSMETLQSSQPQHVTPIRPVISSKPVETHAETYTIEQQYLKTMHHNVTVVEHAGSAKASVEILHYNSLDGSNDSSIAQNLFYVQQVGMRLKQVKITLYGGEVVIEAGALHFMKGNITAESPVGGFGGFARKVASSVLTSETTFKPHYQGFGEIYLEPSFGHFIITYLDHEEMIIDKGMFYASEATIDVGVAMQKHISSALFGGEGLFQTRLSGTGWCVLASPVPSNEIVRYQLKNEHLLVDGNFALLRKGDIDFRVQKSTKTIVGTMTSGEGFLQTFFGTGEVWLAPTQHVYERIKETGIQDLWETNRIKARQQKKQQKAEE